LVKLKPVGDSRIQKATYAGLFNRVDTERHGQPETDRWLTGQIGRLTDKQPGGQETCKNREIDRCCQQVQVITSKAA